MFNPDAFLSKKETPVDEFLRNDVRVAASVDLKDGWLTVSPKRPAECRTYHADRDALGKYLRKLATGRPLSLDDLATSAASLPDTFFNFMPESLSGFFKTQTFDNVDPNMLRLYGLLTPEQKSSMANGGLPFGSLTAKELEYVNRMVYLMHSHVGFESPKGKMSEQVQQMFFYGIMREPTECLPSGVPPEGVITLSETNSNAVFTFYADPDLDVSGSLGSPSDARDLAWIKYRQERPLIFPRANSLTHDFNLSHFLFGRQVSKTFTFHFTSKVGMIQELDDTNLDDFQSMTLSDLPDDFKKQFQDAYNHYAVAYANAKPGQPNGGGSAPPP